MKIVLQIAKKATCRNAKEGNEVTPTHLNPRKNQHFALVLF